MNEEKTLKKRTWELARKYYGGIFNFYDEKKQEKAMYTMEPLAQLTMDWSVEDVRQMKEQRDKAAQLLNQILQEDGNRRYLYHAERTIITNFLNSLNESK